MNLCCRRFVVANPKGVHGRVASKIAELAEAMALDIELIKDHESADCRSILDVLSLALVCGCEVMVRASGKGAEHAVEAIGEVLTNRGDPGS